MQYGSNSTSKISIKTLKWWIKNNQACWWFSIFIRRQQQMRRCDLYIVFVPCTVASVFFCGLINSHKMGYIPMQPYNNKSLRI